MPLPILSSLFLGLPEGSGGLRGSVGSYYIAASIEAWITC